MDYIYLRDDVTAEDLKPYSVLFYPHPVLISEERKAVLEEYVKNGGCLVLGCRSGYKDMYGRCVMDKLPGRFAEMSGVDIPEYTLVSPDNKDIVIDWMARNWKLLYLTISWQQWVNMQKFLEDTRTAIMQENLD